MFKKFGAVLAITVIFIGLAFSSVKPIFENYASDFEVYLNDASSLAQIEKVDKIEYYFQRGVKGESVQLSLNGFSLENLLEEFDAEIKFSEQTSDSEIYYAYSPKIRFKKQVKGQTVNLHVVLTKDRAILGSPLIFGSF